MALIASAANECEDLIAERLYGAGTDSTTIGRVLMRSHDITRYIVKVLSRLDAIKEENDEHPEGEELLHGY